MLSVKIVSLVFNCGLAAQGQDLTKIVFGFLQVLRFGALQVILSQLTKPCRRNWRTLLGDCGGLTISWFAANGGVEFCG